jgi:2-oxoacid:acceptor oxidoreductase gamma subunit (pyruvate/2-ketoisovalerate family)
VKEVRFHGRGGQGLVTAVRLLASALFKEERVVQAFPFFGMERRGAPIQAFLRYSADKPIATRTYVYAPDHIVVFDPTLLKTVNVLSGLKPNGTVLVNTTDNPFRPVLKDHRVAVVDATSIARKQLEVSIVNTTMLGAFASFTNEVLLTSILEVIKESFPEHLRTSNVKAAEEGYEKTRFIGKQP